MTKTLIAKWKRRQDPTIDRPAEIRWNNGMPATLADYARHMTDTSASEYADDGSLTMVMYPEIAAEVWYDRLTSRWVCEALDRRIILDLDHPDVGDDQIIAELSTYPIAYRAVIRRPDSRNAGTHQHRCEYCRLDFFA